MSNRLQHPTTHNRTWLLSCCLLLRSSDGNALQRSHLGAREGAREPSVVAFSSRATVEGPPSASRRRPVLGPAAAARGPSDGVLSQSVVSSSITRSIAFSATAPGALWGLVCWLIDGRINRQTQSPDHPPPTARTNGWGLLFDGCGWIHTQAAARRQRAAAGDAVVGCIALVRFID